MRQLLADLSLSLSTTNCMHVFQSCKGVPLPERRCHFCGEIFKQRLQLEKHQPRCLQKPPICRQRQVVCRSCGQSFDEFRILRRHQLDSHVGAGADYHAVPQWLDQADTNLADTFHQHRNVILAPHNVSSDLTHTYNFPSREDGFTPQEFEEHLRYIYDREGRAFKINMAFGTILQNRETLEFRYFHPHRNVNIYERPLLVFNAHDLEKLIAQARQLNVYEQVSIDKPNTKWRLVLVVNVKYSVFLTSFVLGCAGIELPDHITRNKNVKTLLCDDHGDRFYNDQMCFFRALAVHQNVLNRERVTKEYCETWMKKQGLVGYFAGIDLEQIPDLEETFQINIHVLTLDENSEAHALHASARRFPDNLYLDMFDTHLSLITNIDGYTKKFSCSKCGVPFNRYSNCIRHTASCKGQEGGTKLRFPGGFFKQPQTVFQKMAEYGIEIPDEPFYPYFAVFDYEPILKPIPQPEVSTNTRWINEHIPISVSVASNVPGFEKPSCIVDICVEQLVKRKLEYLNEIQMMASTFTRLQFNKTVETLAEMKTRYEHAEAAGENYGVSIKLEALEKELDSWLEALPCLTFNRSRYDLPLIMQTLASQLELDRQNGFVIKKQNQYMCVSTPHFRFIDICNYLGAGCSYSAFLKTYKCRESKSFFPYTWFDDITKLDHLQLPEYVHFFSDLKGHNVLDAEYEAYTSLLEQGQTREEVLKKLGLNQPPLTGADNYRELQRLWGEENMTSFRDFLCYYNDLDTKPFCEAVSKMLEVYKQRGLDIFKQAISVPGLSRILLFRTAREAGASFPLFGERDRDLHYLFRKNVVGGPSIIFHRYHAEERH